MIAVRPERPEDSEAVRTVNEKAFMILVLDEASMEGVSGTNQVPGRVRPGDVRMGMELAGLLSALVPFEGQDHIQD